MFLLCELDDENYTSPCFSQFNSFKKAFDEALVSCGNFKDDNMRIEVADNRNRISANTDDGHFFVTEIMEFDENKGDYILVWHHAYNGVGFGILNVGTEEECIQKRREELKKIFDGYDLSNGDNEDFDMENDNVVDTGEEWEVFSIVKIENVEE